MKKYCHKNQLFFFFQAEKKYLKTYNIKEHQSSYGILHTSTLGLRFRVAKKHFQPDGDMKLKCKASIGKIFALKKIGSGHCINMLAGTFRILTKVQLFITRIWIQFLESEWQKKNASQYRIAYYPRLIIFPVPYRRHLLANQREIGRRIQKQESFIGVSVHFRQFCSQRRKSSSRYVTLYIRCLRMLIFIS